MKVSEFEQLLGKLAVSDLYRIHTDIYMQFSSAPVWDTGGSKHDNIRHFTNWCKGNPERIATTLKLVNNKISENELLPKSGPVPNTRYILWNDFIKLPNASELIEAMEFSKDEKMNHITIDGYLSVHAIYNMSSWANWKSSSLSDYERSKATAIEKLNLGALMQLNHSRRMNQPALFPVNMLQRG